MRRNRGRYSAVLTALIVATTVEGPVRAQGNFAQVRPCPLGVLGIWKPETTTEANPILLSFTPDGWVSLLGGSAETRAQDFEVLAQAGYRVDVSREPMRIEFTTARGTDVFPPGTSSWEIVDHGDESFTTLNRESGEQSRWIRVQTHRYFLTFAARPEGDAQGGPALVMWTKLDGRRTELEALGARVATGAAGGTATVFGRIPQALASEFAVESDRERGVMMRLELNEAEYHRTHALFAAWEQRLKDRSLPPDDPYRHVMKLLEAVTESLNQCREKIDVKTRPDQRQQPAELIRLMRAMNEVRHVADDVFPFVWEPPPVM
jgi:hypothetical protein